MPEGEHLVEVHASPEAVWDFVKDMDNWAPLVPGYVSHTQINERASRWTLKGDVGILTKKVEFKVTITEWVAPSKIAFTLKGIDENASGKGHFIAEPKSVNATWVTGYLVLEQGGMLGPMVNSLLKKVMPKTTREFVNKLAARIEVTSHARV